VPLSSSTHVASTSITAPTGATSCIHAVFAAIQKEARVPLGGAELTRAGRATELVVSVTSGPRKLPNESVHWIEHVEALPCAAGGDQIVTRWSFARFAIQLTEVFATTPIVPANPTMSFVEMEVTAADVEMNL